MATIEELMIMYALRKRQKRRQRGPLNTSRRVDGEFFSLVLPMRERDDERHFQYFRMSVASFDDLLRHVSPHIHHGKSHTAHVSEAEKLAVTLRFLASGISQQALAASYKLGTATVCCIIKEVCRAIWTGLREDFVAFPEGERWERIKRDFWERWNYPICVGAIDGKHIRVRAPANSGSSFHKYKGYFGFILMAACDARYRFTFVDVGAYGRDSDAGVFARSHFGSQIILGKLPLPPPAPLPGSDVTTPAVFLGDEAFPQKANLMRPYLGSQLSDDCRTYNYRHSRARRVIENSFGILAARWRIFGRAMECCIETAEDITKACIALHNFLCDADHRQPKAGRYMDPMMMDTDGVPGEWRQAVAGYTNLLDPQHVTSAHSTPDGIVVRELFKDFFQAEGSVPWQDVITQRGRLY